MDKVKKLSQAIRLGATFRPQAFRYLWCKRGDVIGTCALGAAYEAAFGEIPSDLDSFKPAYARLEERFPELKEYFDGFGSGNAKSLEANITCANDRDLKSREQIADELERIGL